MISSANKKSVLFLHTSGYFSPIPRIRFMAETLVEDGYEVNVICDDPELPKNKKINGVIVHNIHITEQNKYRRFFTLLNAIRKKSSAFSPDMLQIFSPLLIPISILIKMKLRCKLVYDCYEYWIGSGITSENYHLTLIYAIMHFIGVFFIDGIIFVYENVPTRKFIHFVNTINWFHKMIIYNVPPENIKVIQNNLQFKRDILKDESCIIIGYLGLIMKYKGYQEAVKMMNFLDFKYRLLLIGDSPDPKFKDEIKILIKENNLEERVIITGFLPHETAMDYISNSDIGLILFEDTFWTKYSLPNKLFEYLKVGLPIISSDIINMRYFFEKHKCGLLTPNKPKEIANTILELNKKEKLDELRIHNWRVYEQYYSITKQKQTYLELFACLKIKY